MSTRKFNVGAKACLYWRDKVRLNAKWAKGNSAFRARLHVVNPGTCKQKRLQDVSFPKSNKKSKILQMYSWRGPDSIPSRQPILTMPITQFWHYSHERYKSKEVVESCSSVKESKCVKGKALTGHCLKLWKWSLDCVGDLRILRMPELWNICEGKLHTESGISSREKYVSISKSSKVDLTLL